MATGGREDSRGINGSLKNGTVVPNRIFVGGISENINEDDLRNLFSKYGNVKGTKIINKTGISQGYGFVTFETEDEAQKVLCEAKRSTFKAQNLNVAPAVKKQPYSRSLESNSVHNASIVWPTQQCPGTATGFNRETAYYPQAAWPFMWPQFYLQQQCHYPVMPQSGYLQYVHSIAPDYQGPTVASVGNSDYLGMSTTDSGENVKSRSKLPSVPISDYERVRSTQPKPSNSQNASVPRYNSVDNAGSFMHPSPIHHLHHPVFAKTMNGVTVMAYPSSIVMGNPALVHVKEGNESENLLTEIGFLHSASGALTPPPTPLATIPCDLNANTGMESLRKIDFE